jgi:hypothetical protein
MLEIIFIYFIASFLTMVLSAKEEYPVCAQYCYSMTSSHLQVQPNDKKLVSQVPRKFYYGQSFLSNTTMDQRFFFAEQSAYSVDWYVHQVLFI